MKRFFLFLLCAALSVRAFAGGTVVLDSIPSKILGCDVRCNVYLPDGFETSGKSYPVVYLLHGLSDTYAGWVEHGHMQMIADRLIAAGQAMPMVIIMPNAGHPNPRAVLNGYFNTPGRNYEDFFFQELMPQLESKYRCIGDKKHRAIMGLSMGGGGSTVYCQHHPEMFSSCYAMSPWLDEKGGEVGGDGNGDFLAVVCRSVRENSALDFVDNASEETVAALRTVKWTFDIGDDDWLLPLSVDMHYKMNRRGIPHEFRVRDGNHDWYYWPMVLHYALPWASIHFGE